MRFHQRSQMEARVHGDLRLAKPWWNVELLPDPLLAAGKDYLAPRMVPVQPFGNLQDLSQVFAQRNVVAVALSAAQAIAHQIFDQDRLLAMRLVLRRLRLKVKTDGA